MPFFRLALAKHPSCPRNRAHDDEAEAKLRCYVRGSVSEIAEGREGSSSDAFQVGKLGSFPLCLSLSPLGSKKLISFDENI